MALVTISYDTVAKTLDVMMDGEKQEDISSISVYNYGEKDAHIEMVKKLS